MYVVLINKDVKIKLNKKEKEKFRRIPIERTRMELLTFEDTDVKDE